MDPGELTEGELVERVARGGAEARLAEAEVCRRFAPRIRLYGLRHLRNEEAARDLVQAALLSLLEALRAGRVESFDLLPRFVLGICRNVARRIRERAERQTPHDPATLALLAGADDPGEPSVDGGSLMRCLSALDPRSQAVVHLAFHEGRSAAEIGKLLDLSEGNVRVVRHRAVAQLRRCLFGESESAE